MSAPTGYDGVQAEQGRPGDESVRKEYMKEVDPVATWGGQERWSGREGAFPMGRAAQGSRTQGIRAALLS